MKVVKTLLIVLVVLVVGGRVALPWLIRAEANRKLASLPDYEGHVTRVHLGLWRGALRMDDFTFRHKKGDLSFQVKSAEVTILWPLLLKKTFVGKIRLDEPVLEMVVSRPTKTAEKTKEKGKEAEHKVKEKTGKTISQVLADVLPFRVDRFEITGGQVILRETGEHAEKKEHAPKQAPFLTDIHIVASNLTNSTRVSDSRIADVQASAKITESGHIHLALRLDPVAPQPRFHLTTEIQKFELSSLNNLLEWQTGLHFTQGTFALYSEADAADGAFRGYIKPLVENMKAESAVEKPGLVHKAEKVAINVGSVIFRNKSSRKVATDVPFNGRFDNPNTDVWGAVVELLRNAFIQAIKPGLDPGVHLQEGGG